MTIEDVIQRRKLGVEMIARIEKLPRPEKWLVTREFLLTMNKKASYADHKFIEALNKERLGLSDDRTARSKTGDSQFVLSMPDFIFAGLIAMDPLLQEELNDKDRVSRDRAWRKLANAFPQYKMARENL